MFEDKLTHDDLTAFDEDGYRVLKRIHPIERIELLQGEANRLTPRIALPEVLPRGVELSQTESYERLPSRIEPIIAHSPIVREFALSEYTTHLASRFLGEDVFLLEDKLIYKPPRSHDVYPPHQEWWWTKNYSLRNLMLVIPLTRCTPENGPLYVVAGSHKGGLLPHDSDIIPDEYLDHNRSIPMLLEPGDAAIVDGGTVHFSLENNSSMERTLLLLSYNAAREGDCYVRHRESWTYLPGEEMTRGPGSQLR
jgi:phytanoyl-CoA hydroxylase